MVLPSNSSILQLHNEIQKEFGLNKSDFVMEMVSRNENIQKNEYEEYSMVMIENY